MLYATPKIDAALRSELAELDECWKSLHADTETFSPWLGVLRKQLRASSVESSTSIEGFTVEPGTAERIIDNPAAVVSGSEGEDGDHVPGLDNRMAVACYAHAMDHVGVMATDPHFGWNTRVILDLHFDACSFQRDQSPGHWRSGGVLVTDGQGGVGFTGPDPDRVPDLMEAVSQRLVADGDEHVAVEAAMAHLNVVSVHPFRDGNGRVARIVQSLVLARGGLLAPEFNSIEDYLARHTSDYYAALGEVQQGSFRPEESDATPWLRFCVKAHIEQAKERVSQVEEAARRWTNLEEYANSRDWPDRLVIAMEQALRGGTDRRRYSAEAGELSPATLSGDFRRLSDAGLVKQSGRGPSTRYFATDALTGVAAG